VTGQTDILKLAPQAVLKPWGLRHAGVRRYTGVAVGVGELWLASAQTGPGNYPSPVLEPSPGTTLAELLQAAADRGEGALVRLLGPRGMAVLRASPHRGKTESWHVRHARGRTGFVCGPRTPGQLSELKEAVLRGEISPDVTEWTGRVRELLGVLEPGRG